MKELWLVRHGEAASGPSRMDRDHRLTALGRRQAHATGRALRDSLAAAATAIHASALTRARETAEIIAPYLNAPVLIDERLIEHGSRALLLACDAAEAARRHPDQLDGAGAVVYRQGPRPGLSPEFSAGGESLAALHARARAAYRDLLAGHPGDERCVVVAHGSFLAAFVAEALGLPIRPVWSFQFDHAAPLRLRIHRDAVTGEPLAALAVAGPGDEPRTSARSERTTEGIA